jgi:hypothetical protein
MTPEYTKIPVLNKGIASHCIGKTSAGGHIPPIKIDGERL